MSLSAAPRRSPMDAMLEVPSFGLRRLPLGPRRLVRSPLSLAVVAGLLLWLAIGLWLALVPKVQPQLTNQRAPGPGLDDFGAFYSAARMVREGDGSHLYDLDAIARQEAITYERPANRDTALPFFNSPPFAVVVVPLTYLPVGTAGSVFLLITGALFVISMLMLWRESRVGYAGAWLLLGTVLVYQSVQDTVYHGQLSFVLLFSFVSAFVSFRRGNERLGGFALGLLLLKPNLLVVPLALLLWKRRRDALLGFAAMAAICVAVSVAAAGPAVLWRYPEFLREASLWDDQHGIGIAGMFGWNAFVRQIVGPREMNAVLVWSALLAVPTLAATAWACRGRWLPRDSSFSMQYSAMVICALLINPHVYRQDMILMFVPGFLLLGATRGRMRVMFGLASFAAWMLFVYHFFLLRETGWHLAAPAMAALLALTALASSAPTFSARLRRWRAAGEALLLPQWHPHSVAATWFAAMIDDRVARVPLTAVVGHRARVCIRDARHTVANAPQITRAAKFMLVGASGTGVNLAILWLCTSVFAADARAGWAIAVETSLLSNFTWNRRFTWRTERASRASGVVLEAARYHLACAAGICANFAVFTAARLLSSPALLAGFLGIVAGMALNFTGCVHFVFRARGITRTADIALEPAPTAADEQLPAGAAAEWGS